MKKLIVLLVLIILIAAFGTVWYQRGLQPANKSDTTQKSFVIPRGQALREIANNLKEEGLISDPVVFFLLIKQKGLDQKIQAGNFLLSPSMSAEEVAEMLTKGVLDIWVTIPEGKRADEIADILKEAIPSYDPSWRDVLNQNEGYLFPDTYLIPRDATIDQVLAIFTNNFNAKYETLDLSQTDLTKEEVVIIASILEREVRHHEDLPLVSSVIHNRLGLGMALQVDATIQYAKGKQGSTWWEPVTAEEYKSVKSAYNTYLFPGLPPGPISNPGLKALEAAISPSDTNYLYYISDDSGTNRYATTLEGHNQNIRKYGL